VLCLKSHSIKSANQDVPLSKVHVVVHIEAK